MNCVRVKNIEEEIIDCFFAKNRKERGIFLLKKDSRINDVFDFLQEKFLDVSKMKQILCHDMREQDIFLKLSKECNCKIPYFFSYSLKGYISLKDLCALEMMTFQETIVYFGKGKGYFQAHEKGGSRERYLLKSEFYCR